MAEMKWVKFYVDMFDHPKLKIIDSMEDNNLIHYIWTSSVLLAGKSNRNGELYLSSNMPYTLKTLSIEFRRSIEDVKKSFKILRNLQMIEVTEDKIFKIKNWEKYQNVEGMDKVRKQTSERVAKYRERKREESKALEENADINECENTNKECNVTVTQQNKKENNKKKNKEIDKEKESITLENNNDDTFEDISNKSHSLSETDSFMEAAELAKHCESITGIVSALDIGALNLAINIHGKENVKNAIDKAIEVKKINMPYISGILKNWRLEGYPKESEVGGRNYGGKCNIKSSKESEFKSVKRKEPRRLTEEQREKAYASVI